MKAIMVFDPLFGDGGKGAMTDYLTAKHSAAWNVRFNGGPQAGHNVVTSDNQHHTFHLFGSGTFAGANTLLDKHVRVDPYIVLHEAAHLYQLGVLDVFNRMYIHEDCVVITPYHVQASLNDVDNKLYGSHYTGVREAGDYAQRFPDKAIRISDCSDYRAIYEKLRCMAHYYSPHIDQLDLDPIAESYARDYHEAGRFFTAVDDEWWDQRQPLMNTVIFEGAQGVMLDPVWGTTPYTTSIDCTLKYAIERAGPVPTERVACLRLYQHRHGPGPFPTEDPSLNDRLPEPHNLWSDGQGDFRRGWLDTAMLDYALRIQDCDTLAVSHLDYWKKLPSWKLAVKDNPHQAPAYALRRTSESFLDLLAAEVNKPITYIAEGPHGEDRHGG